MLPESFIARLNVSFYLGLFLSAVCLTLFWGYLTNGADVYNDIVVGASSLNGAFKGADIRIVAAGWCIACFGFVAAITISRWAPQFYSRNPRLHNLVTYTCGFLVIAAASSRLAGGHPFGSAFFCGLALMFVIWLGLAELRLFFSKVGTVGISNITRLIVVALMAFCAISALGLVLNLAADALWEDLLISPIIVTAFGLIAAFVGGIYVCLGPANRSRCIILLCQVVIPLLVIRILVFTFWNDSHSITYRAAVPGWLLAGIFIAASWYHLAKISRGVSDSSANLASLISPYSVAAIYAYLHYQLPSPTGSFTDDFHLGELVLPWDQIINHSLVPYRDFVVVQGFMSIVYGLINTTLFTGTIATFALAKGFLLSVCAGLVGVLLHRRIGGAVALMAALVTIPVIDRFILVPVVVLILSSPRLLKHPAVFVITWLWISLLHVIWIPSVGAITTLATLPWVGMQVLRPTFFRDLKTHKILLIVSGLVLVISLFLLRHLLGDILHFLRSHSASNMLAFGISMVTPPSSVANVSFKSQLSLALLNMVRLGGWSIISLYFVRTLFGLFLSYRDKLGDFIESSAAFTMATGVAFSLAIMPYSLGRIDPGEMSRTGSVTLLVMGFFLITAYEFLKREGKQGLMQKMVPMFGVLLVGLISTWNLRQVFKFSGPGLKVVKEARWLGPEEYGADRLGAGFHRAERVDELLPVRSALEGTELISQPFVDLTNRQLIYQVINRPITVPHGALYLAASEALQAEVVAALEKNPPALVWLEPAMKSDQIGFPLRTYRVFRWFIENGYRVVEIVFGSEKSKNLDAESSGNPKSLKFFYRNHIGSRISETDNDTTHRYNFIDSTLPDNVLQAVPATWGASYQQLSSRFMTLGHYGQRDNEGFYIFQIKESLADNQGPKIPEWSSSGVKVELMSDHDFERPRGDFLLINLIRNQELLTTEKDDQIEIVWFVDGIKQHLAMNLQNSSTLLVPMGVHTSWLARSDVTSPPPIQIVVSGKSVTGIGEMALMRLVK